MVLVLRSLMLYDVNDHDGYWLVYDLILIKVFPFLITFFVLQYSFPCLLFSYEREMLRCNLRFCFSSFLTFFVLLMFLYLLPSEHIARSLIPKSIPIPSLDGTVTESSYSMLTVIHQLIHHISYGDYYICNSQEFDSFRKSDPVYLLLILLFGSSKTLNFLHEYLKIESLHLS